MRYRFLLLFLLIYYSSPNAQLVYWEKVFAHSNMTDIDVASNGYIFSCGMGVYRSTDGGNNWSWVGTANGGEYKLTIDNNDVIYIGKAGSWSGVYKSTDYGATWAESYAGYVAARAMITSPEGFVYIGDESGAFLKSTDSGNSWTKISVTDKEISSITTLSNGQIFISTLGRSLFTSTDLGSSWTQITNSNLYYTIQAIVADSNNYLYAEHSEKISRSTDLGINRELIGFIPTYPEEPVLGLDENNNIYYAYYGVFKSTDFGASWDNLGGPDHINSICVNNEKIFLATYDGIYRYNPYMPIYVGNNYLPLQVGNKWQYYGTEVSYFQGITYYSYYLSMVSVNSDTVINGIKYHKYHSDWVRYSEDDKKIYVRVNDSDKLYLDMTLIPATSFIQYSIFSPHFNNIFRTAEQLHGSTAIFGSTLNYKGFSFDSSMYGAGEWESERYAENFGMSYYYYGVSNYERKNVIIMAILYDSLDNPTYYTNHFKPQITVLPLTIVGSNIFDMTFIVEHHYSKATWYYNFVDSVYMESFYKKDDSIFYNNNISASLLTNTFSYRINTTVDTTLLKAGYSFYYQIVAKDKGLIKETSLAPDTGYYQCIWDFNTGITEQRLLSEYNLFQNYPNPFNPETKIRFQIPKQSVVTLKIYDVLGREISTLVNEEKTVGIYEFNFNASDLASGVYYYQLTAGGYTKTRKMQVIK